MNTVKILLLILILFGSLVGISIVSYMGLGAGSQVDANYVRQSSVGTTRSVTGGGTSSGK